MSDRRIISERRNSSERRALVRVDRELISYVIPTITEDASGKPAHHPEGGGRVYGYEYGPVVVIRLNEDDPRSWSVTVKSNGFRIVNSTLPRHVATKIAGALSALDIWDEPTGKMVMDRWRELPEPLKSWVRECAKVSA